MKSKLWLFLGLLALFGLSAKADWLYWTLDFTEGTPPWEVVGQESAAPQTAWLVVRDDVGQATPYPTFFGGSESAAGVDLSAQWAQLDIAFKSNIGDLGATYNFYIEMGNTFGEAAWVSEGLPYAEAKNAGHISSTSMQAVELTAWTPVTWTSTVPEPTSGLLVLMGMGLLALRRRRTDVRG